MVVVNDPLSELSRYETIKKLSRGHFGSVWLAYDNLAEEKVAVKLLPRGPKIDQNVEREILNHRCLVHHHIVEYKRVLLTSNHLGIVLEYAPGGDLCSWIADRNGVAEDVARWFYQQLMIGMDYMHRMGVANRDIKLQNAVLKGDGWPLLKICDFGYSKHERLNTRPNTKVGTDGYVAPEVVKTSMRGSYDGKKADIWSSGVFLYLMLFDRLPFNNLSENESHLAVLKRISNVDYVIPEDSGVSEGAIDLLRKILVRDPEERPSIAEIQAHPWYQKRLPEGATELNARTMEACLEHEQSEQEIKDILAEARQVLDHANSL